MLWVRRLVADRYELRLHDHLGRTVALPLQVPAGGAPLRATTRFP